MPLDVCIEVDDIEVPDAVKTRMHEALKPTLSEALKARVSLFDDKEQNFQADILLSTYLIVAVNIIMFCS